MNKPTFNTMTSHSKFETSYEGLAQVLHYTIRNFFQAHRRLIWLMCATVSLLSARHLLVEHNVHYPVQLYIIALATATIYIFCLQLLPWGNQDTNGWEGRRKTSRQGKLLVAAVHCSTALSMVCMMQAILHFSNLPVLVMLTPTAFFAESLILFVAGFTTHSRTEPIRLSLFVPTFVGIVVADYRLGPKLAVAIPAMLFAGTASALRKLAIKYYPGEIVDLKAERRWLVGVGILVAMGWFVSPWPQEDMIRLKLRNSPLLAVNAIFTAAALLMGGSIILPVIPHCGGYASRAEDADLQGKPDIVIPLALTAITGCYSTLTTRRSYTSWYQYWCFLFAIVCIGSRIPEDTVCSLPERPRDTHGNYELLIGPSLPRSDENGISVIDAEVPQLQTREAKFPGIRFRTVLVSITLVMLWTAFLILNFTERAYPRVNTILDHQYETSMPLEVVISMYKEPVDEVAQLISNLKGMPGLSGAVFTIYSKGNKEDRDQIEKHVVTKNVTVIALPNIGREGETYLNHILARWDSLAKQTVFLQAHVHNPREFYPYLNKYFAPDKTGYLSLGWSGNVCDCGDCGDLFSWQDETQLFSAIQSRINNSSKCRNVLLSYKGQFIVSAARVRGIDKSIYHDLRQAFVNAASWAHQEDYLRGREDSMSQPWFGYTMERMWNLLFQCSDMDVAWKCPTLLSGWRIGGDISDCQCFD